MENYIDWGTGEFPLPEPEIVEEKWYRRPANYQLGQFDKDMETKREPSLTVPDQSYTVREILEKFTRGLPLDVVQEGSYEEIEDFSGFEPEKAIDITDVETQLNDINERISLAKSKATKGSVKGEVLGGEKSVPDITEPDKATDATT